MGMIAKVLSFVRRGKASDVKVDPGGGFNVTGNHFSAPGDDSQPIPGDYAAATSNQRSGGESIVGYVDSVNEPKANAGEKRIYGRDAETGAMVCEIWMKNDGSVHLQNDNGVFRILADGTITGANENGSFELEPGGDFFVNGATIDKDGNINSPGKIDAAEVESVSSLKVAGKEVNGHVHGGVTVGSGSTGAF